MRLHNFVNLLVLLFIFLPSCNNRTNNISDKKLPKNKTLKQLAPNSHYQVLLWDDYSIKKYVGPDFSVYYFHPTDTTKKMFGNAGIYFGGFPQPIRPDGDKKLLKDSLIHGNFLGKKVIWTIFDYGKSISAETILDLGDHDKVSAFAFGNTYSDIDSLINLLESLKSNE